MAHGRLERVVAQGRFYWILNVRASGAELHMVVHSEWSHTKYSTYCILNF